MFKVLESRMIVPNLQLLELETPDIAAVAKPGQFVIVRVETDGERIPLSLCDWDAERGTITVVVMNVGATTGRVAELSAGDTIPTVVGPLGNATEIANFGTVVCLCGCYGIGSMFPIVRALREQDNRVITVMEGRSAYLFYWQERLEEVSDEMIYITRDGSKGYRGHVGQLHNILGKLDPPANRLLINGCTSLLKRGSERSRPLGLKTIVSLNPIMIDGTGMCGVCRVSIGDETKFACVDGPDFDGHLVDWDELFKRRQSYVGEEVRPLRSSGRFAGAKK